MGEKRKFIRIDVCTEVEYTILPMHDRVLRSESKNISQGGVCILAKEEISKGTFLHLRFHIPDSKRTFIECLGEVVWQKRTDNSYLTGIEFRDLDVTKELKIDMFVLRFLKEVKEYNNIPS